MPDFPHIPFREEPCLKAISPISLGEMDAIRLMNRIDQKYLTDERTLLAILADAAACGYRALVVEGEKVHPYDSVYFDTPQLRMYVDHRRGKTVRQKVRTRCYVLSGQTFLEIKRKNNKGRTKKKRTEIPPEEFADFRSDARAAEFLSAHSDFSAEGLSPALETIFRRITLVNAARTERLTIDTCLRMRNLRNGHEADLLDVVIIELKQDGRAASQMKGILLRHRVKPVRVSKYCIGTALTDPSVASGRFRERVRRMEKIIRKPLSYYA